MTNVSQDASLRKIKMRTGKQIGIWIVFLGVFLFTLYFGSVPADGRKICFRDYAPSFFQKGTYSISLILPSLIGTVVLAYGMAGIQWLSRLTVRWSEQEKGGGKVVGLLCRLFFSFLARCLSFFPSILSAVPPFVSGLFFIIWARLDTLESQNLMYGIICLSLFNMNYFYKRSQKKIAQAYVAPFVLFARSLGLPEKTIFRYYVLPSVLRDHFIVLRELLPHLMVETIVVEYTFSYSALLRSAVDDILYQSWYHFGFFIYALVLFLAFFDILFRFLENCFSPPVRMQ